MKTNRQRNCDNSWRAREAAFLRDPKTAWLRESMATAKRRSKQMGMRFDAQEIECPDLCPVLGIRLGYERAQGATVGRARPHIPSLDRTDPTLGYVVGNVRVISHRANMLKSNASLDELERVLAYVRAMTVH
jgi:hypothetical protein